MTEEQKEGESFPQVLLDRGQELTTELCQKPLLKQLLATMLASRQLYAMTRVELARTLPALLPDEDKDVIEICEEIFVQSIAAKDGDAFDSEDLLQSVHGVVLPFIVNTNQIREAEEKSNISRERFEEEQERRERKLPLGVSLDRGDNQEIALGKVIVFVGKPAYLNWLFRHIKNRCLISTPKRKVLHLVSSITNKLEQKKDVTSRGSVDISPTNWKPVVSANKWEKAMAEWSMRIQAPPDLVLIDNVILTDFTSLVGAPPEMKASAANKAIRKHAAECKYSVIMGLPVLGDLPDMAASTWRSLREFATIRPVWTEEVNDKEVKLVIGKDAWSEIFEKEYLESQ